MMMLLRNRRGKLKWAVVLMIVAFMAVHMLIIALAGSGFAAPVGRG